MISDTNHIIQRHVFELDVNGHGSPMEWEQKAHDYAREILIPGLEKSFLKANPDDRHIVIDKLEIDIGTFHPDDFENDALKRLIPLVSDRLMKICKPDIDHQKDKISSDKDRRMGTGTSSEIHEENVMQVGPVKAQYLAFVNYLKLGRFPWWYDPQVASSAMEDQFKTGWNETLGQKGRELLKEILHTSIEARIRLANNFGTAWIGEFLQVIGMEGKEAIKQWQILLPVFNKYFDRQSLFHQHFWDSWLASHGETGMYSYVVKLFNIVTNGKAKGIENLKNRLLKACKQNLKSNVLPKHSRLLMTYLNRNYGSGKVGFSVKYDTSGDGSDLIHIDRSNASHTKEDLSESSEKSEQKESPVISLVDPDKFNTIPAAYPSQDDTKSLFAEGAGLVLLHPFLQELFSGRNLLSDKHWKSDESAFKAVQLLSYLTFGDIRVLEHQLLLHKVMAGLDLETLISVDVLLTEEEKKACDELLRAVITHWKVLRNTTPAGLQATFIQREGKLSISDEGYFLHIENKTEDILLSHIPWGYGTIKLPWMKRLLHVKWI
ncbi:MAG: contractile injection system tape measure protein [Bacteroidota bacterium]